MIGRTGKGLEDVIVSMVGIHSEHQREKREEDLRSINEFLAMIEALE